VATLLAASALAQRRRRRQSEPAVRQRHRGDRRGQDHHGRRRPPRGDPLIPQLQREARSEQEFNQKLEALQDNAIQNLIDRVLIIKDFQKDDKKHVPESFVDNQIADELTDQFDNDRSKFLAYLRASGTTMRDYRKETEEDIIYNYDDAPAAQVADHRQPGANRAVLQGEQGPVLPGRQRPPAPDPAHPRPARPTATAGQGRAILLSPALGREVRGPGQGIQLRLAPRSKGGDWGWMKRSDLKPEFSEPLFAVKKGECSARHHPRGLLPALCRGPEIRRNPAAGRRARPD
jgi:hypothetical protein